MGKQENEIIINLNQIQSSLSSTILILKYLFTYYSSKFAHTFIEEGSDYNYIPQEAAVEILISSKLEQKSLEIIWNESKESKQTKQSSVDSDDSISGLNQHEFITALQLISLAQANLPYNKAYLYTQHSIPLTLPSILIDVEFIEYLQNKEMKHNNNNNMRTNNKDNKMPYLDPSNTSDATSH